jgi:hypothetical protein
MATHRKWKTIKHKKDIMPDNELQELQELLQKCDSTRDADHAGDPDDIVNIKSETEYIQWIVLPNKAYAAADRSRRYYILGKEDPDRRLD